MFISVVDRSVVLEASGVALVGHQNGWTFQGQKRSIKCNFKKTFGSKERKNFVPSELIILS